MQSNVILMRLPFHWSRLLFNRWKEDRDVREREGGGGSERGREECSQQPETYSDARQSTWSAHDHVSQLIHWLTRLIDCLVQPGWDRADFNLMIQQQNKILSYLKNKIQETQQEASRSKGKRHRSDDERLSDFSGCGAAWAGGCGRGGGRVPRRRERRTAGRRLSGGCACLVVVVVARASVFTVK